MGDQVWKLDSVRGTQRLHTAAKLHLLFFCRHVDTLLDVAQHFVGFFWLQSYPVLMISDNCQQ